MQASRREGTIRSLQTVRSEINERVASQMRPSLRLLRRNDPEEVKDLEAFLRTFVDRRTRLVALDQVYASMRALGLRRELDLLQSFFEHYSFRVPNALSED
jgi:hypothetical protein